MLLDEGVFDATIESLPSSFQEAEEFARAEGFDVDHFKERTASTASNAYSDLVAGAPAPMVMMTLVVSTLLLGYALGKMQGEAIGQMPSIDNVTTDRD